MLFNTEKHIARTLDAQSKCYRCHSTQSQNVIDTIRRGVKMKPKLPCTIIAESNNAGINKITYPVKPHFRRSRLPIKEDDAVFPSLVPTHGQQSLPRIDDGLNVLSRIDVSFEFCQCCHGIIRVSLSI